MITGAIIGAVVGLLMWVMRSNQAAKRSATDALGLNPPILETIEVDLSQEEVFRRITYGSDKAHFPEPNSQRDAILIRRNSDMMTGGYAFLVRVTETSPGHCRLDLSGASLMPQVKKIPKNHWSQFTTYLRNTLG